MTALQKAKTIGKKAIELPKMVVDNYRKPTPKKWVKIGNAIQDVSIVVAGASIFTGNPIIPFLSLVIGKVGKIITDLATEDEEVLNN